LRSMCSEGTYYLRYALGYGREIWPESTADLRYVDGLGEEGMPWQEWISVERNVNRDLVDEFDAIDEGQRVHGRDS